MRLSLYSLITILACLVALSSSAQTKKELDEIYRDANSYFYFEDYEEALALYLQVYKEQPNNSNLNYRIGFCYLNIPGSKDKSIAYLKKAASNTTKLYSQESILETKAPIDAIFYLGNAYFVNNQIDNALVEYKRFAIATGGKGQWNTEYLDHQINTAKKSVTIQKTPINFLQINLGETINDRFANFNPVISGNGKTLAYTTKRKFYQAVFVSTLGNDGEWTTPKNITLDLQVDGNCSTLSLSYDGTELFLFKDDNHDGNIYVSHLKGGKWSPMMKLNKNINSEFYETHACVSSDGKYLYFASNKRGGYGDLDIYVSERVSGDDWGLPRNLGETINSSFNENTPFLSTDGSMLYFSSEGHNNMGGYDIFVSQLNTTGDWSIPINLGYPINSTDDNIFYQPIGNGSKGLMSIFDIDGFGDQDICEVELFIPRFMKNVVSSTSFSERTSDKNYKRIVVDTLNTNGIALMDYSYSDVPISLDPQKRYKLFFEGKSFDIREKPRFTERIVARTEQIQAKELPSFNDLYEKDVNDSTISEPIQERINLLKQLSDTNTNINFTKNKSIDSQATQDTYKKTSFKAVTDNNNLTEILLMLAPSNTQSLLAKTLKRTWSFEEIRLNEKIIEFSQAFETYEEKDAIAMTLATLADRINSFGIKAKNNRLRNISTNTASNYFHHLYNQIINSASPELSQALATTLVNNPGTLSVEELIQELKRNNPDAYKTNLSELVRILAQIGIGNYIKLSDDQKFDLYDNLTQSSDEKTSSWWIYIIIAFVLVSAAGYYLYSKKDSSDE